MKRLLYVITAIILMIPILVKADGLITKIEVEGIGNLTLDRTSWDLNLTSTLDYVNINVEAVEGIEVTGAGQVNITEGSNTIKITATDGKDAEEYTLNINVTRPVENNTGNPETGAFLPSSILVIASVSLIGILLLSKKNKFYHI